MAEEAKKEDEEEIVILDKPPEEDGKEGDGESGHLDDDEPDEDERLAESEDDTDEDDSKRKERRRRKERQRRAREAKDQELEQLRSQVQTLEQRLSGVEGNAISTSEQHVDTRISQVRAQIAEAERIHGLAVSDGNGEDATSAWRIRDEAREELRQLEAFKERIGGVREEAKKPRANPRITSLASEWQRDNAEWYDPQLGNQESRIARAIDEQVAKEGYDPATSDYWDELTRRCRERFDGAKPRRKPTPTGMTREHVPASSKTGVYVPPELKAAIEEAGMWDDPKRRNRIIKDYEERRKAGA